METSNYDGPGLYRHYKGGFYRAWGLAVNENTGVVEVVYTSLDEGRELARQRNGVDFVTRPLESAEGADAWNDLVRDVGPECVGAMVQRFEKVY